MSHEINICGGCGEYDYECTCWQTRRLAGMWLAVTEKAPPITHHPIREKPYVLAVDSKGRMSIGYALANSTVPFTWVFAKPIGEPTHWMPLPELPKASEAQSVSDGGSPSAPPLSQKPA